MRDDAIGQTFSDVGVTEAAVSRTIIEEKSRSTPRTNFNSAGLTPTTSRVLATSDDSAAEPCAIRQQSGSWLFPCSRATEEITEMLVYLS